MMMKIDRYKFQVLAILIAVILGFCSGTLLTKGSKNKEIKKLTEQHKIDISREIALSKNRIAVLDIKLIEQEKQSKKDSLAIIDLEKKIKSSESKIIKEKEKVRNLSTSEKQDWIITRYDSIKPLVIQEPKIELPDKIATLVIDDLITLDGLVFKVNHQDSIIQVYAKDRQNQLSIISTLKLEKEEYEKIIKGKDQLQEYALAKLKDVKKELNKTKLKNVLLSLGISIETVILILLLI